MVIDPIFRGWDNKYPEDDERHYAGRFDYINIYHELKQAKHGDNDLSITERIDLERRVNMMSALEVATLFTGDYFYGFDKDWQGEPGKVYELSSRRDLLYNKIFTGQRAFSQYIGRRFDLDPEVREVFKAGAILCGSEPGLDWYYRDDAKYYMAAMDGMLTFQYSKEELQHKIVEDGVILEPPGVNGKIFQGLLECRDNVRSNPEIWGYNKVIEGHYPVWLHTCTAMDFLAKTQGLPQEYVEEHRKQWTDNALSKGPEYGELFKYNYRIVKIMESVKTRPAEPVHHEESHDEINITLADSGMIDYAADDIGVIDVDGLDHNYVINSRELKRKLNQNALNARREVLLNRDDWEK